METRREFINKSLRLAAFSVITATTGYLLLKNDGECSFEYSCSECNKKKCKVRKEDHVSKDQGNK